MSLVSDLLNDALFVIGVYAPGEVPNTDDSNLALRFANRVLDMLSAEKFGILGLRQPSIPLAGAAASYAFGAAGQTITSATQANPAVLAMASTAGFYVNGSVVISGVTQAGWNGTYQVSALDATHLTINLNSSALVAIAGGAPVVTPMRCMKIKSASVILANGVEMPAEVVTTEKWQTISDKTRTGLYIEAMLWDAQYPAGNLYVSPKPSAGNLTLWIYEQYAAFVNLTDTVSLPPGYELPLVEYLALHLCAPFGRPIPQGLPQLAAKAFQTIQRLSAEILGTSPPADLAPPEQAIQAPGAPAQQAA